jgi:hypothetical protein
MGFRLVIEALQWQSSAGYMKKHPSYELIKAASYLSMSQ